MVRGGEREEGVKEFSGGLQEKPEVECGMITCIHNKPYDARYGICSHPTRITLKWRAAIDHPGKGTVVYVECLNFEFRK